MYRYLPFFGLLFLFACGNGVETIQVKSEDGRLVESYERDKVTLLRQGLYRNYDERGNLLEEANYVNDTLNGSRRMFYPDGQVQIEEQYAMGNFIGSYRSYYPDGQLEQEGTYIGNEMTGPWKRYYEDGQLLESVEFRGNEENGPFVEYYPNGKLKAEGTYANGDNEEGELRMYNESGELERRMDCKNGICRTVWKAKGVEE